MNSTQRLLIATALAAAAIVLVYSNSLHNLFHFDDSHVIETNAFIRSLANAPLFFRDAHTFSSVPANATYRPLVTLSYAIDYSFTRLDPLAYHVQQIVLLLIVWAMLLAFFRRTLDTVRPAPHNGWLALVAATLFAMHTANSETMNFLSCRSELLSAIGVLGAFLLIQYSPAARRRHLYLLPLAFGALAKAPVVVFAPLLLVYVVYVERKDIRDRATWLAVLPSLVAGVVLLILLSRMNAPEWTSGGGSKWHYLITQPFIWLHYARLFFLPVGLTADTDWGLFPHWYDTRAVAGFAFIALIALLVRATGRRQELRPVAFGLWWFAIALIPTSSIFPLAEVMNEHRIFLPYMGLVLAVVSGLDVVFASRRPELAAAACAALLLLGVGTFERNRVWATEESLWLDTAQKSPQNGRALMNYGLTQMAKAQYPVAKEYFDRAALVFPNYPTLEINRGILEEAMGNPAAAELHFKTALELRNDAAGHHYYGRWLIAAGRAKEAIPELKRALQLSPAQAEVRSLLMKLYAVTGDAPDLRRLAEESARINPSDREAAAVMAGSVPLDIASPSYKSCFAAGIAGIASRNFLDAALANQQALRYDPNAADAWNNIGWSLAQLGFDDRAEEALTRAVALRPDPLARGNLAWVLARRNKVR
ncbi:MAG TPA: tetratricopeptide repeat protein [Thermoanaerobaculia bacterium]|nr:tetratricopeptide repeat protein [Thermoanaerobaculia bacterium]